MKSSKGVVIGVSVIAIIAGIGTGFGVHQLTAGGSLSTSPEIADLQEGSPTEEVKVGDVFGSANEDIFKDSAEGIILAGGVEGVGSHHLIRPGGETQTVYVTSSVVDLDKFVNAKVKIWGETNSSDKVGWLMDVGRISVLELNSQLPEDYEAPEDEE